MIALYAVTVVVGACLLFLVQPLIAKIIFPWFGGASAIWSVALVFFQVCLLCGYAYAHWLATRIQPRRQWMVHAALLIAGCALMPILPSEAWRPADGDEPTIRILLLLTATVGLPSILLSSTSPLLQVWYMRRSGHEIPFWLFALSNFGSLIALLSFPLLLEPAFGSHTIAIAWSAVFVGFAATCICVAWTSRTDIRTHPVTAEAGPAPSALQMSLWILFCACGSALLVATSAQLTTNVAPIPLLWVVPLALYLLSFILNFSSRRAYHRAFYFPWVAMSLGCMAWLYTHGDEHQDIQYVIPLYLVCLFVICMACHGEVAARIPAARFVTRFYLLIAFGGALGGMFVGVVAPAVFETYLELPVLLILIAELMVALQWRRRGSRRTLWLVRSAMVAGVVVLANALISAELRTRDENLLVTRNFYGAMRVRDYVAPPPARRSLINGTIGHGYQFSRDGFLDVPGSYFSVTSGAGRAVRAAQAQGQPVRLGIVGLGAGVLTSYGRRGDELMLYEINPEVVRVASGYFTFLSRARDRGASLSIATGDARLVLERQEPRNFDVLLIDAFSSDAIPVHLLTNEAFELYARHLKPDGVLAIHISNRYLDLAPVCLRGAEHVHRPAWVVRDPKNEMSEASDWVLITSNRALLSSSAFEGARLLPADAAESFPGWTDHYSSLWPVLSLSRKAIATR